MSGGAYQNVRRLGRSFAQHLPRPFRNAAKKAEEYARGMVTGGTFFEELGFYYVGPIDGHDMENLVPILKKAAAIEDRPVLVHVVTQKGKGYAPAESSADKLHAVVKFDVVSGKQTKAVSNAPSYTKVFGTELIKHAKPIRRSSPSPPPCPRARGWTCSARPSPTAPMTSASPNSTPSPSPPAWRRRDEAGLRHLFHLPSARL